VVLIEVVTKRRRSKWGIHEKGGGSSQKTNKTPGERTVNVVCWRGQKTHIKTVKRRSGRNALFDLLNYGRKRTSAQKKDSWPNKSYLIGEISRSWD